MHSGNKSGDHFGRDLARGHGNISNVEVDWEKIQAKIEMEFAMEREKAANSSVRSSVSIRR